MEGRKEGDGGMGGREKGDGGKGGREREENRGKKHPDRCVFHPRGVKRW